MVQADRKRELKKAARTAERQAFLEGMPIGVELASRLFDKVDEAIRADTCHDDLRHTQAACEQLGLRWEAVVPWLKENGGGCDCEVVANVEERVEEASGGAE